jgi:hypothetical protein
MHMTDAVAFRVPEVTSAADVRQYLEGRSVAQEYLSAVYGGLQQPFVELGFSN